MFEEFTDQDFVIIEDDEENLFSDITSEKVDRDNILTNTNVSPEEKNNDIESHVEVKSEIDNDTQLSSQPEEKNNDIESHVEVKSEIDNDTQLSSQPEESNDMNSFIIDAQFQPGDNNKEEYFVKFPDSDVNNGEESNRKNTEESDKEESSFITEIQPQYNDKGKYFVELPDEEDGVEFLNRESDRIDYIKIHNTELYEELTKVETSDKCVQCEYNDILTSDQTTIKATLDEIQIDMQRIDEHNYKMHDILESFGKIKMDMLRIDEHNYEMHDILESFEEIIMEQNIKIKSLEKEAFRKIETKINKEYANEKKICVSPIKKRKHNISTYDQNTINASLDRIHDTVLHSNEHYYNIMHGAAKNL